MDRHEAESKLKLYHDTYGDLVYTATPQALREHARDFRLSAGEIKDGAGDFTETSLQLLVKAVQYEAVAQCRDDLGPNWVSPIAPPVPVEETETVRSFTNYRDKRRNKKVDAQEEGMTEDEIRASATVLMNAIDEVCEPETFSMLQLTKDVKQPRFKIGDPAWVADWDDAGNVIGYVPVTIVGLELYPDEVWYMIGFHDDYDGTVTTDFEGVQDEDLFEEMPADIKQPGEAEKPKKSRAHLSVVK